MTRSKKKGFEDKIEIPDLSCKVVSVENAGKEKTNELNFEEALGQLESIVETMEQGDTSLADLLSRFEEGNKLLKVCEKRLRDAELKIEILKKQAGKSEFLDFDPDKA